jgi:cytochrome c-type biogenesis protein CcmE
MKLRLSTGQIIGISVIIASLGLITYQATRSESSVTFYTPEEIYAAPDKFNNKTFRVSGLVVTGTKEWNAENHDLKFRITDLKGHDFNVHYRGIPPDLFKEGQGVIVEGKLSSHLQATATKPSAATLDAQLLMVKHSEVYDTKKDHSQMKQALLLDSMSQ